MRGREHDDHGTWELVLDRTGRYVSRAQHHLCANGGKIESLCGAHVEKCVCACVWGAGSESAAEVSAHHTSAKQPSEYVIRWLDNGNGRLCI